VHILIYSLIGLHATNFKLTVYNLQTPCALYISQYFDFTVCELFNSLCVIALCVMVLTLFWAVLCCVMSDICRFKNWGKHCCSSSHKSFRVFLKDPSLVLYCSSYTLYSSSLFSLVSYLIQHISGIDQASSFHLTHISLSFTVISFTPIFMLFDLYKCLWISGN